MVVWLGALVSGLWWVWPHFERRALTVEALSALLWLVLGALAWVVAFNFGRQRYWRR
jgi:hypothetical protein